MELDTVVRHKFDDILARVKESQSELSIAELGLVKKLTYSAKEKVIVIHMDRPYDRFECPACMAVDDEVRKGIERRLREEFEKEFPGFTVEFE